MKVVGCQPYAPAAFTPRIKGKGKGRFAGPVQHCSLMADCTLAPEYFLPSSPEALRSKRRERPLPAKEGSITQGILPASRNLMQALVSFTCPKVGTWGRLFNFPSEGTHAEDFYIRKIQRLRPGLNPRTREPEASMLTTRPPKSSPPGLTWYSFLKAESTTEHMELSDATGKKPGDTGNRSRDGLILLSLWICVIMVLARESIFRLGYFVLVAQCLNHYDTPGPN
jgi:hypothetical protein